MGTESITVFQSSWERHHDIVQMMRHSDGDPNEHGVELAEFLNGFEITQGKGHAEKSANGGGCLAAQAIAHFKKGSGEIYLESTDADTGTEWLYFVTPTVGEPVEITVFWNDALYFQGTASEFLTGME